MDLKIVHYNGRNILGVSHPLNWGLKDTQFQKSQAIDVVQNIGHWTSPKTSNIGAVHQCQKPFESAYNFTRCFKGRGCKEQVIPKDLLTAYETAECIIY
jgi:hypothetical protein